MEMKVDEGNSTFEFEEKDLKANSTYLLRYLRLNGVTENIGSGTTDGNGNLKMSGEYGATLEDLHYGHPPKYELICLPSKSAAQIKKEEDQKKADVKKKEDAIKKEEDQKKADVKKKEDDIRAKKEDEEARNEAKDEKATEKESKAKVEFAF